MYEAIFSLIGVAVGIVGTYCFSLKTIRHQELGIARANFRVAFLPITYALSDKDVVLATLIDNSIHIQEAVFWKLLAQLDVRDREGLHKAWGKYESPDKELFPEKVRISYECNVPGVRDGVAKILRKRINKLMEYAEIAS